MLVRSTLLRRLCGVGRRPSACSSVAPRAAGHALHRCLHQSPVQAAEHPINAVTPSKYFESDKKNRETFLEAIELFDEMSMHRRGHVEFILAALEELENFGVHRDLQVYKKLLGIFPRDKMVSRNFWQVALMHYPKQQDCALLVLQKMEDNNLMPDVEMRDQLIATFGKLSYPVRRVARMFYWMPKFRHLSPWPLPDHVPADALLLAQLAVTRIASVDPRSDVTTYLESDMPTEAVDRTWVVSAQSQQQRHLLQRHDAGRPLLIEGAFRIWLRDRCVNYFILRAEPTIQDTIQHEGIDSDDLRYLQNWTWQSGGSAAPVVSGSCTGDFLRDTEPDSAHRQSDGTILAVCATGSSSRDSLLSWIRLMQRQCPRLAQLPILFPMRSPLGDVIPVHQSPMEDSQMTQKHL